MPTNSHLTLVGPRHGDLFSDPAAGAIWAALLTLDVALQHEFLARLQERLAVPALAGGTHKVRIARLVAATREADGMLLAQASGDPAFDPTAPPALTEDAYEQLRKRHREFGWPPASTMRSWVQGGWNDVLRRAMLKTVDGGDAVFMVSNTDYTWEEVAAAVCGFRDYLTEQGHPTRPGSASTTSSTGRNSLMSSRAREDVRAPNPRSITTAGSSQSRQPRSRESHTQRSRRQGKRKRRSRRQRNRSRARSRRGRRGRRKRVRRTVATQGCPQRPLASGVRVRIRDGGAQGRAR